MTGKEYHLFRMLSDHLKEARKSSLRAEQVATNYQAKEYEKGRADGIKSSYDEIDRLLAEMNQ